MPCFQALEKPSADGIGGIACLTRFMTSVSSLLEWQLLVADGWPVVLVAIPLWQGIDWRDRKNWDCNERMNPNYDKYYDGISISPFEVMFIEVKARWLDLGELHCLYTAAPPHVLLHLWLSWVPARGGGDGTNEVEFFQNSSVSLV
jgi:hypothetical protein